MSAVQEYAVQAAAAVPHFAAKLPIAVGLQWHFAAALLMQLGFAALVVFAVRLAGRAVDSIAAAAAIEPVAGCAVGGQPETVKIWA